MNAIPTPFRLGYRPSLNGLRGVAIIFVLFSHGGMVNGGFGFFAVNTFFVLSGFLITCLLVEEYDKTNDVSLRRFYFRRALRLLPALAVMLVVFVAFSFLIDPYKRAVHEMYEALSTFFYFSNWARIYHFGRHLSLAHTWSLSVEEQFYILWPGILLVLLSRTTRSSLLCWVSLAVFLAVVARIGLFMLDTTNLSGNVLPVSPTRLMAGTDARADSLLLGCLAALLISSDVLPQKGGFKIFLKIAATASGLGLLWLGTRWEFSANMICWGWLAGSVFAVMLILHLVSGTRGWLHWIFENQILVYIGQISYGLYLWHYFILIAMQQHQLPWKNMLYLMPVIPIVLMSYYFIEKPCLKFKKRFQMVD